MEHLADHAVGILRRKPLGLHELPNQKPYGCLR
jgi:hypothetical protein